MDIDGDEIGSSFGTNQIYPTVSGLYGVTAYYDYPKGTCVSNTVLYDYELFQTGLNDYDDVVINCVPNPFVNQSVVYIERNILNPLLFDLYDSFGKKVWSKSKLITQEKSFVVSDLVPGIYYFHVTSINLVRVVPIIVLK